jgi:hypothetical protein
MPIALFCHGNTKKSTQTSLRTATQIEAPGFILLLFGVSSRTLTIKIPAAWTNEKPAPSVVDFYTY